MKFIDAHSHIWTPDTKAYPLGPGYRRFSMKPPSFTVAELQANMKQVGVNRVVLIQMSFYGFDNSYMLDAIRKHPGMFSGVAVIDQDACIKCGRCYAACEDTSHQAIWMKEGRVFEVNDAECVACNLCIDVCPVEDCITMERMEAGSTDPRTGKTVSDDYANWTTHPNNPMAKAAE